MQIDIQNKESTIIINKLKIAGMQVMLFTGATVSVDLYSNDLFIRNEKIDMSVDDYNSWTTDEYIINYVLEKLGFVIKPADINEPPAATEPAAIEPDTTYTEPTATETTTIS